MRIYEIVCLLLCAVGFIEAAKRRAPTNVLHSSSSRGVTITKRQQSNFACAVGEIKKTCRSRCEATCTSGSRCPMICTKTPVCVCQNGFVRHEGICIPQAACQFFVVKVQRRDQRKETKKVNKKPVQKSERSPKKESLSKAATAPPEIIIRPAHPPPNCGQGQAFTLCVCDATCDSGTVCTSCKSGCGCFRHFVRNSEGVCVPFEQCPEPRPSVKPTAIVEIPATELGAQGSKTFVPTSPITKHIALRKNGTRPVHHHSNRKFLTIKHSEKKKFSRKIIRHRSSAATSPHFSDTLREIRKESTDFKSSSTNHSVKPPLRRKVNIVTLKKKIVKRQKPRDFSSSSTTEHISHRPAAPRLFKRDKPSELDIVADIAKTQKLHIISGPIPPAPPTAAPVPIAQNSLPSVLSTPLPTPLSTPLSTPLPPAPPAVLPVELPSAQSTIQKTALKLNNETHSNEKSSSSQESHQPLNSHPSVIVPHAPTPPPSSSRQLETVAPESSVSQKKSVAKLPSIRPPSDLDLNSIAIGPVPPSIIKKSKKHSRGSPPSSHPPSFGPPAKTPFQFFRENRISRRKDRLKRMLDQFPWLKKFVGSA